MPCYDPATREHLGDMPAMDQAEVESRIKAAQKAAEVTMLVLGCNSVTLVHEISSQSQGLWRGIDFIHSSSRKQAMTL